MFTSIFAISTFTITITVTKTITNMSKINFQIFLKVEKSLTFLQTPNKDQKRVYKVQRNLQHITSCSPCHKTYRIMFSFLSKNRYLDDWMLPFIIMFVITSNAWFSKVENDYIQLSVPKLVVPDTSTFSINHSNIFQWHLLIFIFSKSTHWRTQTNPFEICNLSKSVRKVSRIHILILRNSTINASWTKTAQNTSHRMSTSIFLMNPFTPTITLPNTIRNVSKIESAIILIPKKSLAFL